MKKRIRIILDCRSGTKTGFDIKAVPNDDRINTVHRCEFESTIQAKFTPEVFIAYCYAKDEDKYKLILKERAKTWLENEIELRRKELRLVESL